MIECNYLNLDLNLRLKGGRRKIGFEVSSDLPCGTVAILTIFRNYWDYQEAACEWAMYDDKYVFEKVGKGDFNGFIGEVDVNEGDCFALEEFNDLVAGFSSGINGVVESSIHVSVVVGARQRLKAFGKNNVNLGGALVVQAGGINVASVEEILDVPMNPQFQPVG